MTALEMKFAVLLQVDSLFENAAPGYNNAQMEYVLNKAQRTVFNEKKKLYDTDETIKKMLSPVVRRASLSGGTIVAASVVAGDEHDNGVYYRLPSDTGYVIEEFARFDEGDSLSDPVLVLPISYDYYTKNYKNRYKKPYSELVWRLDYKLDDSVPPGTKYYTVELITDGVNTLGDYQISYLKFPTNMVIGTTNCEIVDTRFHDEIVNEAVKIITASLSDADYQVAINEKNFDK